MVMHTWSRWRSSVVVMSLGALLLTLLTTDHSLPADADEKAVDLPADLAKIPSDGLILFSIRVADLWTGEFFKSVRQKDKEIVREAHEFEERFGLPLEQVERLTGTIVGPPPASREFVLIVRTIKPYELAKVLATDVKFKRETYMGQTLYVTDKWAVYPLDDRSLAYSEFPSELRNLIDHPRPKEKGGLTNGLVRAAEKHALVAGINVKEYHDRGQLDKLPPGGEPFRPLFLARWTTLVVDVGAESRLAVTAHFANEKDTNAASKVAHSALELLRTSLDQGVGMLSKDKDMEKTASMLKQLKQPLKATQIEQKGETLQASLQAKVDLAESGMAVMEAIQKTREKASRIASAANFHNLAIALHMYADAMKGRLPAQAIFNKDGKPLLSWRVLLLPYLDQKQLFDQFHFNEPWDSEHNKKLLSKMPKVYAHPHDEKTLKEHTTYYQGFVGKGAFFDGKQGLRLPVDIPDGVSLTIMLVEASKAVPWTKPEDIPYDPDKPLPKLGLPGTSSFSAVLCDGAVRLITPKMSQRTLRLAITRNDGMPMGPDF